MAVQLRVRDRSGEIAVGRDGQERRWCGARAGADRRHGARCVERAPRSAAARPGWLRPRPRPRRLRACGGRRGSRGRSSRRRGPRSPRRTTGTGSPSRARARGRASRPHRRAVRARARGHGSGRRGMPRPARRSRRQPNASSSVRRFPAEETHARTLTRRRTERHALRLLRARALPARHREVYEPAGFLRSKGTSCSLIAVAGSPSWPAFSSRSLPWASSSPGTGMQRRRRRSSTARWRTSRSSSRRPARRHRRLLEVRRQGRHQGPRASSTSTRSRPRRGSRPLPPTAARTP